MELREDIHRRFGVFERGAGHLIADAGLAQLLHHHNGAPVRFAGGGNEAGEQPERDPLRQRIQHALDDRRRSGVRFHLGEVAIRRTDIDERGELVVEAHLVLVRPDQQREPPVLLLLGRDLEHGAGRTFAAFVCHADPREVPQEPLAVAHQLPAHLADAGATVNRLR